MKKIYFLLFISIALAIFGKTQTFIRIYNSSGKKIATGHFIDSSSTDSFLVVKSGNTTDTISIKKVAYIKTKHSIGNNIIVGTAIAAPTLAIVALMSNTPCTNCLFEITDAEAAASGFITGAILGAVIGTITGVFKNSKTISIHGDFQKWHVARMNLKHK